MKRWFPLGESIRQFLMERRSWLENADLAVLIPGIIRLNKASVYTVLGELEPAARELNAVTKAGTIPCGLELAYLQHSCNLYYQFSLWNKMDPMRDRLLALARGKDYRPGIAQGLYFTGLETINSGDYPGAISLFLQALETEGKATDPVLTGEIYNDVGFCYRRIGDAGKAEDYYRRALAIREESGNLLGQAESLSNLGYLKINQGYLDQAETLLNNALQLESRIGDKIGAGYTLVNLGYLAFKRGEFVRSRDYHTRALDLRTALNDHLGQGHCFLQLRALAEVEDDGAEELRLYNAAYHAFVLAGDTTGQKETILSFAEYWLGFGRVESTERILGKHAEALQRTDVDSLHYRYDKIMVLTAISRQDRAAIERWWTDHLPAIAGQIENTDLQAIAARIQAFLGDTGQAIDRWQTLIGRVEKQGDRYSAAQYRFNAARLDAAGGRQLAELAAKEFREMGAKRLARRAEQYLLSGR